MTLDVAHARKLLDAHQPFDAREAADKLAFNKFFDELNPTTGRSADGRLTAAGWVVDPATQKLLVIRNDKLNLWLNPGGKYEPEDGTVIRTVQREVMQEAGVAVDTNITLFDISVIGQDFNPRLPCTFYDLRFLVIAHSRAPLTPHESDKQPRWVTLSEAMQLMPDDIQNYRLYRRTEQLFEL